jgi:hypothetical protein
MGQCLIHVVEANAIFPHKPLNTSSQQGHFKNPMWLRERPGDEAPSMCSPHCKGCVPVLMDLLHAAAKCRICPTSLGLPRTVVPVRLVVQGEMPCRPAPVSCLHEPLGRCGDLSPRNLPLRRLEATSQDGRLVLTLLVGLGPPFV